MTYARLSPTQAVLLEVANERQRQEEKWGQQNHPWALPYEEGYESPTETWLEGRASNAEQAKALVQEFADLDQLAYCDILMEEVIEALDEKDLDCVREELVQVAAVAVAAIESIDRNGR